MEQRKALPPVEGWEKNKDLTREIAAKWTALPEADKKVRGQSFVSDLGSFFFSSLTGTNMSRQNLNKLLQLDYILCWPGFVILSFPGSS